ncbi:FAD-dependent oxidoreductase [Nonomuraea sp. NPDC050404]|uniref:FAD-dependent oxidoreductase n=1 Tax=Nonomuraea sp. NPDC050404 TaxID=3155783 RepID=UPI00340290E6
MRVGIVGAGLSGLTLAWLLASRCRTVVLESLDRIGGTMRSVHVRTGEGQTTLDLGAQDISPDLFPAHRRLLSLLGFTDGQFVDCPASLTVLKAGLKEPLLVSPHTPEPAWRRAERLGPAWHALNLYLQRAAEWDKEDVSWERPLADLVEPLPVSPQIKHDVLYARPAFLFCCGIERAMTLSARAAAAFYVSAAGEPSWQQLVTGLESVAWALAARTPAATIKTAAGVRQIRRSDGRYELLDTTGERHIVDELVLAVPPWEAAKLLHPLAGTREVRDVLAAFEPVDTTYALHLDPAYLPECREQWSTSTFEVHDGWSESTDWFGPGRGVEVFKSQLTHRDRLPQQMVLREDYRHLLITPAAVRAQRRLAALQGREGLHFAGQYTTWVSSQESAVRSAVEVARRLAPRSGRLTDLLSAAPDEGVRRASRTLPPSR